MANLSSAIKRIQNKGKKSVDPKKNHMAEVSPAMMAVAQGAQTLAAVAAKAAKGEKAGPEARRMVMTHQMATKKVNASYNYGVDEAAPISALAKGAAMVGKAAMKSGAKATGTAAKAASKTSKPVARKLTTRRNVKNPKYRNPDGSFNKKLYDQDGNKKTQGYMSTMDGPTDNRKDSTSDSMRQTSKVQDAEKRDKEKRDEKVKDTAQNLKKKTGGVVKGTAKVAGNVVKKTAGIAKKAVGGATAGFGASSFRKESKITFKDYLNKL